MHSTYIHKQKFNLIGILVFYDQGCKSSLSNLMNFNVSFLR